MRFLHTMVRVADLEAALHFYCDLLGLTEVRRMEHEAGRFTLPRDGRMAFVRSPDGISIEILQEGDPLTPVEPWLSMPNTGVW